MHACVCGVRVRVYVSRSCDDGDETVTVREGDCDCFLAPEPEGCTRARYKDDHRFAGPDTNTVIVIHFVSRNRGEKAGDTLLFGASDCLDMASYKGTSSVAAGKERCNSDGSIAVIRQASLGSEDYLAGVDLEK